MQEQSTDITPKGENVITLEDMEEEGSTVRQIQHNTDITNSEGAKSIKLQCPETHTQVS